MNNKLLKPNCLSPLRIVNVSALKMVRDGGTVSDGVPVRPRFNSVFSDVYKRQLYSMAARLPEAEMSVTLAGHTEQMFQLVPCGKCELCVSAAKSEFVRRAQLEGMSHDCPPFFFTLTYNDDHLPPDGELDYREIQLYLKRLRKLCERQHLPTDFRYIIAGEYGSKRGRPHYHVILFNNPLRASEFEPSKVKALKRLLWTPWQKDDWNVFSRKENFGQCYGDTAAYVTKYIGKRSRWEDRYLPHRGRCVRPSFVRSSSRPGIGALYLKKFFGYYHLTDDAEFEYLDFQDGQVKTMPFGRYMRRLFHPTPLQQVPSAVRSALHSLTYSLEYAVRYGLMLWQDAYQMIEDVRPSASINRLPLPADIGRQVLTLDDDDIITGSFVSSAVMDAIYKDYSLLADYAGLPDDVQKDYWRYKDAQLSHERLDHAAKLYRLRCDSAKMKSKMKL